MNVFVFHLADFLKLLLEREDERDGFLVRICALQGKCFRMRVRMRRVFHFHRTRMSFPRVSLNFPRASLERRFSIDKRFSYHENVSQKEENR